MSNFRQTWVHINTAALQHNIQRIRELAPNSKIMAVIKADGYGHNMETVAEALNTHADEYGVNGLDDVIRLRDLGVDKPLTVLSSKLNLTILTQLAKLQARATIYDLSQLAVLEQLNTEQKISIWLKIDTGMGRLGILPEDLPQVMARLNKNQSIGSISLLTHLANADHPEHRSNQQQIELFSTLAAQYEFAELSILNSAGLVSFSQYAFDFVRPGIMLYGISPSSGMSAEQLGLQAVMTFKSELISVKRLSAGSAVGYGSAYVLDEDTVIGIVGCGYGDGYPRHAPTGTPVLVNGLLVPLIGRVSMDMICVDLGQIRAKVGDQVVLWGEGNPIEVIAEYAGTIAYELCCGILPRVERIVD